jgi:hypothetical protein
MFPNPETDSQTAWNRAFSHIENHAYSDALAALNEIALVDINYSDDESPCLLSCSLNELPANPLSQPTLVKLILELIEKGAAIFDQDNSGLTAEAKRIIESNYIMIISQVTKKIALTEQNPTLRAMMRDYLFTKLLPKELPISSIAPLLLSRTGYIPTLKDLATKIIAAHPHVLQKNDTTSECFRLIYSHAQVLEKLKERENLLLEINKLEQACGPRNYLITVGASLVALSISAVIGLAITDSEPRTKLPADMLSNAIPAFVLFGIAGFILAAMGVCLPAYQKPPSEDEIKKIQGEINVIDCWQFTPPAINALTQSSSAFFSAPPPARLIEGEAARAEPTLSSTLRLDDAG